jgi:eukaryotic-like serine/threonine-protein kinase
VRKDLGIEPVPVPTGRSSAGPQTLRPTNRPTRPRHPSDPGTAVIGGQRTDRSGRTSMLPAMGAGPTMNVNGRRPAVERARPGVPQHIRRRRARLAVALVALLTVTIGAVGWWLGEGRWTTVPELIGEDQNAAIDLLQNAGLDPDCCEKVWSEEFPAGAVMSTEPKGGGEAIRGSDIHLVVSQGPERFTVPTDLVNRPLGEVVAFLQEERPALQVATAEEYDSDVDKGLVIRFDPPAGTELRRDQVVTVFASLGHAPVAVPDVTGQSPEQAKANLEALGFTVERGEDGRSAAVDKGEVMAVAPGPADGPAAYGSEVTITVSAGVPLVTVPNVVGMNEGDAKAAIQAAGLAVDSTKFFGSKVRQQQPAAGEKVEQGSSVRILVAF